MIRTVYLSLLFLAISFTLTLQNSVAQELSDGQKKDVEALIQKYLSDHPEAIAEGLSKYQQLQQKAMEEQVQKSLRSAKSNLLRSDTSPVLGNPKGDVTVVMFFDYQCGFCKKAAEFVPDVIQKDGKTRLVMKEFPVLGQESILASAVALASAKQGKYEQAHHALMSMHGPLTEETIMATVASAGIDMNKLQADLKSPSIRQELQDNMDLGKALRIDGTPGFVVGTQIFRGIIQPDMLQNVIAQERKKKKEAS